MGDVGCCFSSNLFRALHNKKPDLSMGICFPPSRKSVGE